MRPKMEKIVEDMPKIELHAHLNGCISDELLEFLRTFAKNDSNSKQDEFPHFESHGIVADLIDPKEVHIWDDLSNKTRSLDECWEAFGKIIDVIRTPRVLYVATLNVIAQFSRDNVIYLELRTGAKKIHEIPSKIAYIEAVVKGIQDGQRKFPIIVKLLISINRGNGEDDAYDNLNLALTIAKEYPEIMVGIDVSGDPNKGNQSWLVPVMQEARRKELRISCHLAEIVNPEEILAFMKFAPERVGHGQFLHPFYGGTDELWELTKKKKIPIETCISSNLVSGVTKSLSTHIVRKFFDESIPFVICTDDCGVFKTTLTNEYKKLLKVTSITMDQLYHLCLESVTYAFASREQKDNLTSQIEKWWCNLDDGEKSWIFNH